MGLEEAPTTYSTYICICLCSRYRKKSTYINKYVDFHDCMCISNQNAEPRFEGLDTYAYICSVRAAMFRNFKTYVFMGFCFTAARIPMFLLGVNFARIR